MSREHGEPTAKRRLADWLGRLLCLANFHDYQVVEVYFGFAPGEGVERVACRRCGRVTTRRART